MTPLVWMVGVSVGSWLLVTAAMRTVNPEAALGMLGPLTSACATWVVTARVHRAAPERVTRVMVAGLAVKMVFFGVFVAAMLRGLGLRPPVFVLSFTGYFIALHAMEAFFLRRLFADSSRPMSGA